MSVAVQRGSYQTGGQLPREGTKLRALYDLLYAHRGRRVPEAAWFSLRAAVFAGSPSARRSANFIGMLNNLRDFYGCDVRDRALVGEWCGRVYVDYTEPATSRASGLDVHRSG